MKMSSRFSLRRSAVGLFLVGLMVIPVAAQDVQTAELNMLISEVTIDEPHVEGEVLVKFKEKKIDMDQVSGKASLNSFAYAKGLNKDDTIASQNITLLSSKSDESTEQLIDRLQDDSRVEYVEPNYLRKVFDAVPLQHVPNDTRFPDQWNLNNASDADIDAPEAWNIFTGSSSTIVGILDTGADITHPDLVGNFWNGSVSAAGCKDDNGVIIAEGCPNHGWDYVNNDNDPTDDHGHGTHVASTIGARGDNDLGIAGINLHVSLMPIKVADKDGFLSSSDWIKGLHFAQQNGAKIVNASFGGFNYSQAEHDAIKDFPGLFVAAAGNQASDNDNITTPNYPSNYPLNNIIAVAATDSTDALASFSNYGVTSVDVAAPGVDILGAIPGGTYVYSDGTSMASPHVAGLAALLLGYDPHLTIDQIKNIIDTTGDSVPGLSGKVATGKRINALRALNALTKISVTSVAIQDDGIGGRGKADVHFRLDNAPYGVPVVLKSFEYSVDKGVTFVAPQNGDLSESLSSTWNDNAYILAAGIAQPFPEFTFSLDLNHVDLANITTPLPSDIRVRFAAKSDLFDPDLAISNDFNFPTASLSGVPTGFVASKNASIVIGGTDVASYAYTLDSAVLTDFSDVSKPLALANLPDGMHTLSVYGKDENGNVQLKSTDATWSVDTTAPVGTIAVTTTSPMKTKTPALALAVSDSGIDAKDATKIKVQLSCDNVHFSDPMQFSDTINTFDVQSGANGCGLTDGDRNVYAQFQDSLGNVGTSVKTDLFAVFTSPVVAQILTKPSSISAPSVTFTLGGTFVTAYKYRLDPIDGVGDFSPETPVSAPLIFSGASALSDGAHKIEFLAKDDVGGFQPLETATNYSWTVDAIPPTFSLSGTPANGTTSTSASILAVGADVTAYRFSQDSGTFGSEIAVTTPITLSSLAVGSHTVKVIARDALGNYTPEVSAVVATWTIAAPPAPVVSAPASSGGSSGGGGSGNSGSFAPTPTPVVIPVTVPVPVLSVLPVLKPVSIAPVAPQAGVVLGASTVNLVNGLVLKLEGRGLYYIIENGKKRPIPYATYRKKYFKTSRAVTLPASLLKKIPQFRPNR